MVSPSFRLRRVRWSLGIVILPLLISLAGKSARYASGVLFLSSFLLIPSRYIWVYLRI